ncbi:Transcriptional repressor OPI1 [Yarrowia sp. C11]|nr:Transcriptional repressor OPI1 [Yarrowia sp. E02]KAG5371707.1 Transcriptional repressor OPI1 [Yarrowia sp. C11]
MSTPSPPPLLSSSSGDSSNASLATMNQTTSHKNRVSIQSLCNDGASINSVSSGNSNRRGSIQDILNDEPVPSNGFHPNSAHVGTPNGATNRYSQNDYFAAETLGNLKANAGHIPHVTSPPPRVQNAYEVPIQIQPEYQPLKGLYSDTFPPNAPNPNLNPNLHKTHERDTANFPSDKGAVSISSSVNHISNTNTTFATAGAQSQYHRLSNTSKTFTRDSPYHSRTPSVDDDGIRQASFLNRVYQSSKSYSPRFRYGAEIVERWASSETNTNTGAASASTPNTNSNSNPSNHTTMPKALSSKSLDAASIHMASNGAPPLIQKSSLHDFERLKSGIDDIQNSDTNGTQYSVDVGSQGLRMRIQTQGYSPSSRGSPVPPSPALSTSTYSGSTSAAASRATSSPVPQQQAEAQAAAAAVAAGGPRPGQPRSAWQEVLISATSLASLSQDSRKRLRYCLHLLKLANAHLASTVTKLQGAIAEETAYSLAQSIAANHVPHNERQAYLHQPPSTEPALSITALKADVVSTIRKIIKVVSQYAGNSLPEPARSHIRTYILGLPSRWASTTASTNITPTRSPAASQSPVGSPKECVTPNHQGPPLPTNTVSSPVPEGPSDEQLSRHRIEVEAGGKVLILANEALDMLGNIISIVDGTLERAEGWCEGINRVKQRVGLGEAAVPGAANEAAAEASASAAAAYSAADTSTDQDVEMGDA